jgi:chitodextrinase
MTTYNLNVASPPATFNASGTATAFLSPPSTEYWDVTSLGVQTTDSPSATVTPIATITLDGVYKEATYSGSLDASDTTYHIEKGQRLTCTWTGGTPGKTAILTLNGTRSLY